MTDEEIRQRIEDLEATLMVMDEDLGAMRWIIGGAIAVAIALFAVK